MLLSSLLSFTLAAELQLMGSGSSVQFLSGGASVSATCFGHEGASVTDIGAVENNVYGEAANITLRLQGVPITCVGVAAAKPCVAHPNMVGNSLKRAALFYCAFQGSAGTAYTGPYWASLEEIFSPSVRLVAHWPQT